MHHHYQYVVKFSNGDVKYTCALSTAKRIIDSTGVDANVYKDYDDGRHEFILSHKSSDKRWHYDYLKEI